MRGLLAIGSLGVALATACGPRPAASDAERHRGIPIVGTPPPPELEQQGAATAPLDLVEGDGELLMHVDVAAMRQSVAYGLLKQLVADELPIVKRAKSRCGLDLFDAIDVLAVSAHELESGSLVVARINVPPDTVMACGKKVMKHHETVEISGIAAIEQHDRHLLVVDDLLFLGGRTEVKRALARRTAPACTKDALRSVLSVKPDTPLAVVLDGGPEELEGAELTLALHGQTIRAKGRVSFRDTPWKKRGEWANRFEEDLQDVVAKLRHLVATHMGEKHPLLDDLKDTDISKQEGTVHASLTVPFDAQMKPALDRALGMWALTEHAKEAKMMIGAISRGAAAAFEREIATTAPGPAQHSLCKSAIDVPAKVPAGTTYQPSDEPGEDYDTGDTITGWRCLKFALHQPQRFQLSYRQGGNYKGPPRGGPDPGPHGYEASAEGDLDGDGKTSLFTVVGIVDPRTQKLRRVTEVFVSDEVE